MKEEPAKNSKGIGRPRKNPKEYAAQRLLHLNAFGAKLEQMSKATNRSQSEIVRKLIAANLEMVPEAFRPVAPAEPPVRAKRNKVGRLIYLGKELSERFEIFCANADIKMSHLVVKLLKEEFRKWPKDFFVNKK